MLGERLIAFRDTQGRIGLMDEFCAHRGVSLWFGRNEENGLRCCYHGWKFDVTGQCVEVPSEPAASGFAQKIKLKSYPTTEAGGVIWAYMGPEAERPRFASRAPKRFGLGLPPRLGQRGGKVGEKDREEEPDVQRNEI